MSRTQNIVCDGCATMETAGFGDSLSIRPFEVAMKLRDRGSGPRDGELYDDYDSWVDLCADCFGRLRDALSETLDRVLVGRSR